MYLFCEIVFCLTALGILHTYVLYPALLLVAAPARKTAGIAAGGEDRPALTIICAAYNEEKVIEEKIRRTFTTAYPLSKISLLIGTDNCSDSTVAIIRRMQAQYPQLQLVEFTSRTGKIGILNDLCARARTPLLVLTDANVYFGPATLNELVKNFADPNVALVCGNIEKRALNKDGVTRTELQYMNLENRLKLAESSLMHIVMGAEGGCYAIRREIFRPVPATFIADDFFVTCLALRARKKIVFEEKALAYEDVQADTRGEFRRKARIATGNFQNLFYFKDLFYRFWSATAFAFFSHKALRWFTPFLFLLNMVTCALLWKHNIVFRIILLSETLLLFLPLLNRLLLSAGVKFRPLIAAAHLMVMNAALAAGFFRFLRGVKNSVWEPVKR
jgi:cellulose synthase/poly-beta-1,6-N-acetylglucosamine synthase-like glycosyltransferase